MQESLPYIVPIVVTIITYLLAPPVVARIKGTADKEQTRLNNDLQQLENWRKAREIEHSELTTKHEALQRECELLREEVRTLKRKEEEHVKELQTFRVSSELMEQQITGLRNDNYRLMQKVSMMERNA